MLNLYRLRNKFVKTSLCVLSSDDEEVSLVIESACPDGGNVANEDQAADAPDEDTLSLGPDMPDLPLDAPPGQETPIPPGSAAEATATEATATEEAETEEKEEAEVEEESTVREDPPSAEPQVDPQCEATAGQPVENSEVGGEETGGEAGVEEEQRAATQAEEEVEEKVGEDAQPKSDSPEGVTTSEMAASAEGQTSQGPPVEPAEGPPQEVTEGGDRSSVPCSCQSLFSNYNSQGPSRRKVRPCSLPVSELENVIASACGEPETPRSHYIRIHHLLHSLPSAQHRSLSQEEEESGESVTQESTSPTLKTSKEEGQDDEDEEDTTQSPSQVQPAEISDEATESKPAHRSETLNLRFLIDTGKEKRFSFFRPDILVGM